MLQPERECGKLIVKDNWVMCPVCRKGKLIKLRGDSTILNVERKCKRCGQISNVNIDQRLSQSGNASA